VYALVAGVLATAAVNSLLAWGWLSADFRPAWRWQPAEAGRFLRYGRYMVGENFANVLNRQADVFVGGLAVGPAALGLFAVPRDLSLRLGMVINQVITRVGFPVMAQVKEDLARLQAIYLRMLRMNASVNFPVFVALALFAEDVVAVLYGAQWRGAAEFLRILAAWGLVRSVGQPIGALLYAVGHARQALLWNLAQLALFPPLYLLAARAGGLPALAWAMLALQLVIFLPAWAWLVRPACGASLGAFLLQPAVPLALALAAGAAAWLATVPLTGALARLAVGGGVGLAAYLALSFAFNRAWTDLVRDTLRRPRAATP
jgi:O-antigen/teichoic acid export membrane protein